MNNYNHLFYTCSLIEYIGRETRNLRSDVLDYLGERTVKRIYNYADVFHCEPIEKVAAEFIEQYQIPDGQFDNVAACKYVVPSYWDIGSVFARLIQDVSTTEESIIHNIFDIYHSWIEAFISNYNRDFFYQSQEYIAVCYKAGEVLD